MRIIIAKNTVCYIIIAFVFLTCQSPASISGRVEGAAKGNVTIYLIKPESLRDVAASYLGRVIDSAVLSPDGRFKFNNLPKSEIPVLLEIAIQQPGKAPNYLQADDPRISNYMPILWQFGDPIEITAKSDEFQKSFSMNDPSVINQALLNLRDINFKAYQTYVSEKHWHAQDGDYLMEKEHAILQYKTKLIEFADSIQYLIPALVALRWVSPENDYERVPEFLVRLCDKWKKKQPDHPWVNQLCGESIPSDLPVLIGDEFPGLKFPLITKDTLSLKDLLGSKLTIIDIWASWCGPCRKENRDVLVPLWEKYHDQGLQIVAYGLESDESTWNAAVERDGANRWVQSSDLQGDDAPLLGEIRIQTIPANFILDDKGVVVAKNIHGNALIDLVKRYIEKDF